MPTPALHGPDAPLWGAGIFSLGTIYPGGSFTVVSNSAALASVVTTVAPHGLTTLDKVFFATTTNSTPAVNDQEVVTVLTPTTFSIPVDCTGGAGTVGAFDYAIVSAPVTGVGVPATINTGTIHGLRVGDTVTIVASGSTPSLDGAQVVTAIPTSRSFQVGAVTNLTVAASTTAAHYSKTTFYSDVWDSVQSPAYVGLAITSVIGSTTHSTLVDIQGSFDGQTWFNTSYATMAAPQTLAVAQLTISTATSTSYKLANPGEANYIPYRFVRLKFTTSTNIIMSASLSALRAL